MILTQEDKAMLLAGVVPASVHHVISQTSHIEIIPLSQEELELSYELDQNDSLFDQAMNTLDSQSNHIVRFLVLKIEE